MKADTQDSIRRVTCRVTVATLAPVIEPSAIGRQCVAAKPDASGSAGLALP